MKINQTVLAEKALNSVWRLLHLSNQVLTSVIKVMRCCTLGSVVTEEDLQPKDHRAHIKRKTYNTYYYKAMR